MSEQRAAIVTGASSGIGLAIADVLGQEGYALTIAARRPEKLEAAAAGLREKGYDVETVAGPLGDEEGVKAVVAAHRERYGRLDVLVNNAGVGIGAQVAEIDTKKLDMQLGVNLRSIILFYRETVDLLRAAAQDHGTALVINTASIAGKRGQPWLSVYSATKGAVVNFTEAMHKELSGEGIKSTALCPGFVDTPMTEFVKQSVPAADMITPDDIAEAVRLLLKLSPACIIPEIQFIRPGIDGARQRSTSCRRRSRFAERALGVGIGAAVGQPAAAGPARLARPAVAGDRLVLGDRGAEVGLAQDRRLELVFQHAQLAGRGTARALGAGEAIPRVRERDEARAAAVAVRGEHRADPAGAVAVGADDDLVGANAFEHRLARAHRQAVDGKAQVVDRRVVPCSHRVCGPQATPWRSRRQGQVLLLKGTLQ